MLQMIIDLYWELFIMWEDFCIVVWNWLTGEA